MQRLDFSSAEFLGSSAPERVIKCRQLAAEADRLAANATDPKTRTAYFELKRLWHALADEIEKFDGNKRGEP